VQCKKSNLPNQWDLMTAGVCFPSPEEQPNAMGVVRKNILGNQHLIPGKLFVIFSALRGMVAHARQQLAPWWS
jgi:hypothetical protein